MNQYIRLLSFYYFELYSYTFTLKNKIRVAKRKTPYITIYNISISVKRNY